MEPIDVKSTAERKAHIEPDLLFSDVLRRPSCREPRNDLVPLNHFARLRSWVALANGARMSGNTNRNANQYDKAEELLTWYAFAPFLRLSEDDITKPLARLVALALSTDRRAKGARALPRIPSGRPVIQFEFLAMPPEEYLDKPAKAAGRNHPVKYVREIAEAHITHGQALETQTHFDLWLEWPRHLAVGVEAKFTSDADCQRTYSVLRNQVARGIDAGAAEAAKRGAGAFVYILIGPRPLYRPTTRWYAYLLGVYAQDPQALARDLPHRTLEEAAELSASLGCLYWEDVRAELEQTAAMHPTLLTPDEATRLREFFEERRII
jgi:hypothetical protein